MSIKEKQDSLTSLDSNSIEYPKDEKEVSNFIKRFYRIKTPIEITGTGSKIKIGKPLQCGKTLNLSGLNKIIDYLPEELFIKVKACTPIKIIEEELDSSEKWINTIQSKIEKFCKKLSEQTNITIKVHSDSIQYFQNSEFEIEKIDSKLLSFIGDDSLEHGECIIESDNHIIDATFQTQITHIINNIS